MVRDNKSPLQPPAPCLLWVSPWPSLLGPPVPVFHSCLPRADCSPSLKPEQASQNQVKLIYPSCQNPLMASISFILTYQALYPVCPRLLSPLQPPLLWPSLLGCSRDIGLLELALPVSTSELPLHLLFPSAWNHLSLVPSIICCFTSFRSFLRCHLPSKGSPDHLLKL